MTSFHSHHHHTSGVVQVMTCQPCWLQAEPPRAEFEAPLEAAGNEHWVLCGPSWGTLADPLPPMLLQLLAACDWALRCCHILWFLMSCGIEMAPGINVPHAAQTVWKCFSCSSAFTTNKAAMSHLRLPGISLCISSCPLPGGFQPLPPGLEEAAEQLSTHKPPDAIYPSVLATIKLPTPSVSLGSHKFTCAMKASAGSGLT